MGNIVLCLALTALAASEPALIPQPAQMELRSGTFELTVKTSITFAGGEIEAQKLAAALRTSTDLKLPVSSVSTMAKNREIAFLLQTNQLEKFGAEGYALSVTPEHVGISAATEAGLFYGGRTLLQLLPPGIFSANPVREVAWTIPCVEIADSPRFAWRGFMLDEARHFFGKATVIKLLDTMADLKLNRFHWHLTDDRWRIEIKQYPKLTTVGAVGNTSNPDAPAAFYTQDDIREIVRYAAERHIVVIPEIEMPGHARGATIAYPELAGGDESDPQWKLFTYDPASPAVRRFLEGVLDETSKLFPGPYLHLGGDETHFGNMAWTNRSDVQAIMKQNHLPDLAAVEHQFMRQMAEGVARRGKKAMCWDAIAQTGFGLPANQVVPIWWHDEDLNGLSDKISKGYMSAPSDIF